jgi:hypothetical protein
VKKIIIAGLILLGISCTNNSVDGYLTIEVKSIEQVNNYTYLLVKEKGPEYWIAVPTMDAHVGDKYRYKDGLLMEDFYSTEMDKTFDKIVFLNELLSNSTTSAEIMKEVTPGSMVAIEKSDVDIERTKGIVSIAELFKKPEKYEGKIIQLKGEVIKFNGAIMNRNWIHIQDGTEYEGKFDLTLTSQQSFLVGSTIVVEGLVKLNQDFGYGYTYEILIEEATEVK